MVQTTLTDPSKLNSVQLEVHVELQKNSQQLQHELSLLQYLVPSIRSDWRSPHNLTGSSSRSKLLRNGRVSSPLSPRNSTGGRIREARSSGNNDQIFSGLGGWVGCLFINAIFGIENREPKWKPIRCLAPCQSVFFMHWVSPIAPVWCMPRTVKRPSEREIDQGREQ